MDVASIVSLVFESLFKYLPQLISIVEQIMQAIKGHPAVVPKAA